MAKKNKKQKNRDKDKANTHRRQESAEPQKIVEPQDSRKLKREKYESEFKRLHCELCHAQEWVRRAGARIVIVFEGRDAAGKGGTIRAITQRFSLRVFRVVALPTPSERVPYVVSSL